jgi:hypothetical protein
LDIDYYWLFEYNGLVMEKKTPAVVAPGFYLRIDLRRFLEVTGD